MKNFYLFFAGFFLLVLSACQNDEFGENGKGMVAVSFTAQLPEGGGAATRTGGAATPGDGSQINRCILEVYLGDKVYTRKVVAVANKAATFTDVRLLTSQTYDFVFWADHVTDASSGLETDLHYTTNTEGVGLTGVTFKGDYAGSTKNDTRDAFFAKVTETVTNALSLKVDLYRPFGQLRLITDDYSQITNGYTPTQAKLAFSVPNVFNALTGEPTTDLITPDYTAADIVDAPAEAGTEQQNTEAGGVKKLLTLDYVFAPSKEQLTTDVTLTAITTADNAGNVTKTISTVPIKRNYITNVTGNLLTSLTNVTATMQPAFTDPAETHPYTEVATTAEIATELSKGATAIKVTNAPTSDATIELPDAVKDKNISISMPATTAKVTIKLASSSSTDKAPKALTIDIPTTSEVDIQTPNSTVTLNGTTYAKVTASTATNTLVVAKGVTVTTLEIAKGNVDVYGTVTNFARTEGNTDTATKITYYDTATKGTVSSGQTDTFVIYEVVTDLTKDLSNRSNDNLIIRGNGASISSAKSIVAKSIDLSGVKITGESTLEVTATAGITLKDIVLNTTGNKATGTSGKDVNHRLLIKPNGSEVVLDNITAPAGSTGYNGIEFSQDWKAGSSKITIKNCDFDFSKWTHNCVNIYSFADNAVVDIENCNFILEGKNVPNVLRLSNYLNATGVKINVKDCSYKYINTASTADADKAYYGFFFYQGVGEAKEKPFSSWTVSCNNLKYDRTLISENGVNTNDAATQLSYMYYDWSGIVTGEFPTYTFNSQNQE